MSFFCILQDNFYKKHSHGFNCEHLINIKSFAKACTKLWLCLRNQKIQTVYWSMCALMLTYGSYNRTIEICKAFLAFFLFDFCKIFKLISLKIIVILTCILHSNVLFQTNQQTVDQVITYWLILKLIQDLRNGSSLRYFSVTGI